MPRPKGVLNKIENIVAVFTRLGGTAAMAEWARRNQTEFYRLYARLIPTESTTEITQRDVRDLSTEELLAMIRAAQSPGEEVEPDIELGDELHWGRDGRTGGALQSSSGSHHQECDKESQQNDSEFSPDAWNENYED